MADNSPEYMHVMTLADDLERLGVKTLTPHSLRMIAGQIEAEMIMQEVSFNDFENLGDIEL